MYVDRLLMTEDAAATEVRRHLALPTSKATYFVGWLQILDLRTQVMASAAAKQFEGISRHAVAVGGHLSRVGPPPVRNGNRSDRKRRGGGWLDRLGPPFRLSCPAAGALGDQCEMQHASVRPFSLRQDSQTAVHGDGTSSGGVAVSSVGCDFKALHPLGCGGANAIFAPSLLDVCPYTPRRTRSKARIHGARSGSILAFRTGLLGGQSFSHVG